VTSRGLILFLLFLILSATATFAATPANAPLVIELIPHPGGTLMMTMHATINGHEGNFVFDTGAGVSYVSPDFAHDVGCKPWGKLTGYTLVGQRLDMQRCDGLMFDVRGQRFGASTSGVFDLMKFMPPNVPKVDGSIGLDIFEGHALTLSLASKELIVETPVSLAARAKRANQVPIRFVREAGGAALTVFVAVPTVAGTAWMEIDCGNGGANVIGKHLAELMKLDPNKKEPQPAHFTIGGGVPVEGMARVNDSLIMDGNIGTRFLIDWDLTLDLSKGQAWFAPAKDQSKSSKQTRAAH
jgi:aspartyl protease